MEESEKSELRGKLLPNLVLRPYLCWAPHKIDNRCFVYGNAPPAIALVGLFVLPIVAGIGFIMMGIGLHDVGDLLIGDLLFLIGGGGCILTYTEKNKNYSVFDRRKGEVRFWTPKKRGKPSELICVPFGECEARLMLGGLGRALFDITHENRQVIWSPIPDTDRAMAFVSFLAQYMAKGAPLPDVGTLETYANRTKGVGSAKKWEEMARSPGFADPLAVWRRYWATGPPEELAEYFAAYEPRRMPVNAAVTQRGHGQFSIAEPRDRITALPKQVMRPFDALKPVAMDEDRYIYKRPLSAGRYFYLADWVILCAGIALFAVHTGAALAIVTAAVLLFAGFIWQRRTKGTIFDRKNGLVILHHGLRFAPLKLPFEQCQGRLVKTEHVEGFNSYRLHLHHPRHGSFALDDGNYLSLDYLLSFWSFIVQYMDKDAPLPQTKESEHLENTTEGLGPWDKWAVKAADPGFVDPFAQWLEKIDAALPEDKRRRRTRPMASRLSAVD